MLKEFLCEDYIISFDKHVAEQKALQDIECIFRMHGKKCCDFGLPEPCSIINAECIYNPDDEASEAERLITTLNPMQKQIFNEIIAAVSDTHAESRFFFIDGPGGSGKT